LPSDADPRAPAGAASLYDGLGEAELAERLGAPKAVVFDEVSSTLDVAHELAAAGAPAGTIVLADAQSAGRGRLGRSWRSERGAGIWLTVIDRPRDAQDLDVLPLRIGIALAPALDAFAEAAVSLKWPNDLYVGRGKLAGVLTEARWRGDRLEWIAIGVGINVRAPAEEPAAGLSGGTLRLSVLEAVVPAIRDAARCRGSLTARELAVFAARDQAVGKECVQPVEGRVCGIDASGALLVGVASGTVAVRSGSLVLKARPDA
jgi:BirA family transcriptional regulator, biotin operon repressor / biotin---[acetyl-CoA-carboxylase] ligase